LDFYYSMILIIKFYYCKICGIFYDKYHLFSHEINSEFFGYQVFYDESNAKYYIQDTYSSQSISTESSNDDYEFNEWYWTGSREELLYLITNNLDLKIPNRLIDPLDNDYHQIFALYHKLIEYLKI
jgi:hypothetical protein